MTRANLPVIMVVTIADKQSHRVEAEYLVKITVPMEPGDYAPFAIARIKALDVEYRAWDIKPLIPNGCICTTLPLEFNGNVYQMWARG